TSRCATAIFSVFLMPVPAPGAAENLNLPASYRRRMFPRAFALLLVPALFAAGAPAGTGAPRAAAAGREHTFSGSAALAFTRRAVAFGPRPDGSPAIAGLRAFIRRQLAARGCALTLDDFSG